ncbi:MAG: copper resistance protein NlpE N-terminal domain-containing protein [Methylobacter sp.]|nr:copper resistance protein NlpE N-terminal domain-containing protein [Methylobacter sp.]
MRTFRQPFKQLLTFFLLSVIFSGYNPAFAETAETRDSDKHHAQNSADWPGVYYGFIPCNDCKGIKSTLALNNNNSYILITQYVGKSEREIVEKGRFTSGNQVNTIVLTSRKTSTTRQYLIGENRLIQLDDKGNRISGKLADRYILRRKSMTEPAIHSSH